MTFGDPQAWASHFKSVDQRLMERIHSVWQKCLAVLPPQPGEDSITQNLIHLLCKDSMARRLGTLHYQYEPFQHLSSGAVYSTGSIDFVLVVNNDRDMYVAYECKRLNVINAGRRASLATPYVNEGMMRFVKAQYSAGLPFACMLGYVMDADISFARQQVWQAINTANAALLLSEGPASIPNIAKFERFFTAHQRAPKAIEIRHAFLAFSVNSSG